MSTVDSKQGGVSSGGSVTRDPLGTGGNSSGGAGVSTMLDYSSIGESCHVTMGIATMMAKAKYDVRFANVARLVQARTASEKQNLEVLLAYYFAVHGTSPQTRWAEYDKSFVREGIKYPPYDIVKAIGEDSLKQFCARFSDHVRGLFESSSQFRDALSERAARLGLDPSEGIFVVDFYGKDGSLDSASMSIKAGVRNRALRYRAGNSAGVMTQARTAGSEQRLDAPPVIPEGLQGSFKSSRN